VLQTQLQCVADLVAVCCSVLQCVAMRCSVLQPCALPRWHPSAPFHSGALLKTQSQCVAASVAVCCRLSCSVLQTQLQCVALRCSVLQSHALPRWYPSAPFHSGALLKMQLQCATETVAVCCRLSCRIRCSALLCAAVCCSVL